MKQEARIFFEKYDTDKSGLLSSAEFKAMLNDVGLRHHFTLFKKDGVNSNMTFDQFYDFYLEINKLIKK